MPVYKNIETIPDTIKGSVVCIGNFDGVHKGHQKIIKDATEIAKAQNIPLVILTFYPHPRIYLRNHSAFLISPPPVKYELLAKYGIDNIIELNFETIAYLEPLEFIEKILHKIINAKFIIVGENFKFGHGAKGDVTFLKQELSKKNIGYKIIPSISSDSHTVSSSEIRRLIGNANMEKAKELLGHDFYIEGQVMHGDKVARTLDSPTINLSMENYIVPKIGIYTANIIIEGYSRIYNGVANLGYRPTLDGIGLKLEAHIFDFNEEIYGKIAKIILKSYLREEIKFENFEVLKKQIHKDISDAKDWFYSDKN